MRNKVVIGILAVCAIAVTTGALHYKNTNDSVYGGETEILVASSNAEGIFGIKNDEVSTGTGEQKDILESIHEHKNNVKENEAETYNNAINTITVDSDSNTEVMSDSENSSQLDERILQQEQTPEDEVETWHAEEISEVLQDIDIILENCNREFIGDYTVDESFMFWLYSEYGRDVISNIEQHILTGEQSMDVWKETTGSSIHVLWSKYCRDSGFQADLDDTVWRDGNDEVNISMDFTGDINLSEGWSTTIYMDKQINGIYECFSKELIDEMNGVDVMTINNEFTYSTRGTAIEGKDYTFRADPSRVEVLDALGVDVAGIANNHVYDYGEEALLDTISTLDEANIAHTGAGKNLKEASEPVYIIVNNQKIAIVAATQIERSTNYTKEATEDSAGVLKALDPELFCEAISNAKQHADKVIAFIHWGTEGDEDYGYDQRSLAEAFVEAGADAIIGGHTHCLQGIGYVGEVPVVYSLGNFWFNGNKLDTGLARLNISNDGTIGLRFIPCIQAGTKVSIAGEEDRQRIISYVQSISDADVIIDGEGNVNKIN